MIWQIKQSDDFAALMYSIRQGAHKGVCIRSPISAFNTLYFKVVYGIDQRAGKYGKEHFSRQWK